MIKKLHNSTIKIMFIITLICCCSFNTYGQTIYTNDMDYVIGDAKQAFIQNRISTETQADNLLKGMRKLGVNGIRIPIFPRDAVTGVDVNPNKPIMDYFYTKAVEQGVLIFANPAQGGGGARIANNSLSIAGGVNGVQAATDELIARVLEFSDEYPDCKWLNPFNEDGRATNSTWSVAQYHTIYGALYNNVNGAELVGPCTWGLPAAIDMFQNTNIADYITVATSHNLGFNHNQWSSFINLANAENLPVWDSEVTHTDKFGTGTRLEKAIENEVDGLVLYNIWNTISLTDGSISSGAQNQMLLYLKDYELPVNIAINGVATQSVTTSTTVTNLEAARAIDGNTSGVWNQGNPSISHTVGTNPWWQLDLQSDKEIGEIRIYNRAENRETLSNFTVTVTNTSGIEVFTKTYIEYPNPLLVIETGSITGQIVKIQLNGEGTLSMAEVEIYGANDLLSTKTEGQINLNIYPNPIVDILNISSPIDVFKNYTIYNINGQIIATEEVNSKELKLDLSAFSKGIYILKLEGDLFLNTHKVIKN
ncbi:MAG: T9SS type A sorting domain-containing protein [Algibacter sp.]